MAHGESHRVEFHMPEGATLEYAFVSSVELSPRLEDPQGNRLSETHQASLRGGTATANTPGTYSLVFRNADPGNVYIYNEEVNLSYRVIPPNE